MGSWIGVGSECFWNNVPESAGGNWEGIRENFTLKLRLETKKAFFGSVVTPYRQNNRHKARVSKGEHGLLWNYKQSWYCES